MWSFTRREKTKTKWCNFVPRQFTYNARGHQSVSRLPFLDSEILFWIPEFFIGFPVGLVQNPTGNTFLLGKLLEAESTKTKWCNFVCVCVCVCLSLSHGVTLSSSPPSSMVVVVYVCSALAALGMNLSLFSLNLIKWGNFHLMRTPCLCSYFPTKKNEKGKIVFTVRKLELLHTNSYIDSFPNRSRREGPLYHRKEL